MPARDLYAATRADPEASIKPENLFHDAVQEVLACLRDMYARQRRQTLPASHSMDEPGPGGNASAGAGAWFPTSSTRSATA